MSATTGSMTTGAASRTWTLTSGQQEAVKWAAVLLMVVDHVAVAFLDGGAYLGGRMLGRLSLPLFGFLIAYNIEARGVDPRRYVAPMGFLLAASQVPYMLFGGRALDLNIFAPLLAGVLLVLCVKHATVRNVVGAVAAAALFGFFNGYGFGAVLLVPAWALVIRKTAVGPALALAAVLLWLNLGTIYMIVPLLVPALLEAAQRLPLNVKRMPRWFFYAFYPAHLAVLVVLRAFAG